MNILNMKSENLLWKMYYDDLHFSYVTKQSLNSLCSQLPKFKNSIFLILSLVCLICNNFNKHKYVSTLLFNTLLTIRTDQKIGDNSVCPLHTCFRIRYALYRQKLNVGLQNIVV
ncbi:hypothetical protein QTP88_012181 [Uroleucon formosanum]